MNGQFKTALLNAALRWRHELVQSYVYHEAPDLPEELIIVKVDQEMEFSIAETAAVTRAIELEETKGLKFSWKFFALNCKLAYVCGCPEYRLGER